MHHENNEQHKKTFSGGGGTPDLPGANTDRKGENNSHQRFRFKGRTKKKTYRSLKKKSKGNRDTTLESGRIPLGVAPEKKRGVVLRKGTLRKEK